MDLILLSPSPEVNKLTFPSIPTTTTIAELREKISAAVASHPAPGRQRLIYRGHALVDGRKTLKDTFTQEIVRLYDTFISHVGMLTMARSIGLRICHFTWYCLQIPLRNMGHPRLNHQYLIASD